MARYLIYTLLITKTFHLHEILRTMLAEPPQINTIISLSGLEDS